MHRLHVFFTSEPQPRNKLHRGGGQASRSYPFIGERAGRRSPATETKEKSVISRKLVLAFATAGVLSLGAAACGDDDESSGGSSESGNISGSIKIDGSSTVLPFAEAAAELFNEENPDVNITVGAAGTSGGFEKFCAGEIDISDASRPIDPKEEVPICKKEGISYQEVQVANDGIAVVTNPALEISCLTTDQLAELWSDDTTTNYSDLGDDADTGQPLPEAEFSLYGPGTDSGTFDYFTDVINGEEGLSRQDYQPSEDDNQLVQGVAGDENGLGYFGFSYYEQNQDQLNLVSVDEGSGCVAPSVETIQSGDYSPLSRPLFMYPSTEALQRPEVAGFMQFVVDNYSEIAEAALIVPMDSSQADEAKSNLDSALQG
jgi:phosphate transport system substrate-binding protein